MLFRIKFISDEVEGFLREIEIESDATFLELNEAVLSSCGYPDDQMTSFYICNDEWERKQQITREDMGTSGADEDIFVMERTRLSEFIEDEDQKMEFIFDPFSERAFYLDVTELIPGKHLDHPVVVRSKGEAPVQIKSLDEELSVPAKGKKSPTLDEDEASEFYGNEGFESDEFDPEGFEISEGDPYRQ